MMTTTRKPERGYVESRSNSLAVKMPLCPGTDGGVQLTAVQKKGSGDVESRRNSLAVSHCIDSSLRYDTETQSTPMERIMQTEIEILEPRENPMIVWY